MPGRSVHLATKGPYGSGGRGTGGKGMSEADSTHDSGIPAPVPGERPPATGWASLVWMGFAIFWFGGLAWAISIRMRSDSPLAEASTSGLYLIVGLPSIVFLVRAVRDARRVSTVREAFAASRVGPIVVFLVQSAGFLLLALGTSLVIAARAGHTITITPDQAEVTEGELFSSLVWQASRAVPVVELPTSLGWENPVPDPAWPLGLVHLVIKAVFAGVLLSTAVLLWRTWRKRSTPARGVPPADW